MRIEVQVIARHRNGIDGAPFHVAMFIDKDNGPMVAIVFEKDWHCAVLQRDRLAAGDIAFGSNSWRGDWYEAQLREAIKAAELDRNAPPMPFWVTP